LHISKHRLNGYKNFIVEKSENEDDDWLLIESNEVIPKEVKQDILEQTSLIQIVGKDYCKGNVELYLLKSIK